MAVKPSRSRPKRPAGRPRSSDQQLLDTREALLGAAAELIAERGFRGTTVAEVVTRSGLSKGTFYWHFKSKEDLLVAVLEERIDRPLLELVRRLETASAQEDMAPQASRMFVELVEPARETILLEHEYRALAMRSRKLRARYLKRQEALREALAAGLDARARQLGAPPFSMPTRDVATAYLNLGSALAVERLIDASNVPDDLLGETVALVYQGLVARARSGS
jgi:TetR/AcrR family acrAB operon transcriptional repressor